MKFMSIISSCDIAVLIQKINTHTSGLIDKCLQTAQFSRYGVRCGTGFRTYQYVYLTTIPLGYQFCATILPTREAWTVNVAASLRFNSVMHVCKVYVPLGGVGTIRVSRPAERVIYRRPGISLSG